MAFFEPRISFTYEELENLIESITLEICKLKTSSSRRNKKKIKLLSTIREKLESGNNAGCG